MSEIKDRRWAMGLGMRAGIALLKAENALRGIQATAVHSDWNTTANLRAARLELNKLAKEISHIISNLEEPPE